MKKIVLLFNQLILIFVFSLLLGTQAHADTTIPGFLLEIGKSFYARGNYQEAIHEFSKVLIVDPENQEAKQYLAELGLKEGLYNRSRTYASQIADLTADNMQYKVDFEQSQGKQGLRQPPNHISEDKAASPARNWNLPPGHNELASLTNEPKTTEELQARLHQSLNLSRRYEEQLTHLGQQYGELKEANLRMDDLNQKIAVLLDDYFKDRSNKVPVLRDALVLKQLDLTKYEYEFLSQLGELIDAHESIVQYQKQLHSQEAILEEKRKNFDLLKNDLE